MNKQELQAELNYMRSQFCSGANVHEFLKTCIALELAASYRDEEGNIVLEGNVRELLAKLRSMINT